MQGKCNTNEEECKGNYMEVYKKLIYKGKEANITRLNGKDLKEVCMAAAETAGGMGQWVPADVKTRSDKAFDFLTDLLDLIEHRANWPKQTQQAREHS